MLEQIRNERERKAAKKGMSTIAIDDDGRKMKRVRKSIKLIDVWLKWCP